MDKVKISRLIEHALSALTGSRWELLEQKEDYLRIRVISDSFEGERVTVRIPKVSELFYQRAKPLTDEYGLILETWTEAELEKLQKGFPVSTDSPGATSAAAASSKGDKPGLR